jgi:hypothetical protein
MTAKGHVQHPAENSQRTPLILVARIEGLLHGTQSIGHIDRPSRQYRAIL